MDSETPSFENSFWSATDNDFTGFDILSKRLKDGKHMYDEIADFISRRIKIEQNYAKELQSLVKSTKPCTDSGTTKVAWEMLKVETSKLATVHSEMVNEMKENVLFNVNNFRDQQRDSRKKTEDAVTKVQKAKMAAHTACEKAHQKYVKLSKEADKAVEDLERASKNAQLKEVEKMRTKEKKAKQLAESADSSYKDANNHLDHCRRTWEREMVRCCKQYQILEEQRLEHQRNALWVCMNISSAVAVEVDKRLEMCRQALETIDVEKDIQSFIQQNRLGSVRPDRVPFYHYKDATANSATTGASNTPRPKSMISEPTSPSGLQFAQQSNSSEPLSRSGSIRPSRPSANALGQSTFKAAYKYEPQGPQEIPLQAGALVKVIEKTDDNWWKATSNGRTGMVPKAYLKAA